MSDALGIERVAGRASRALSEAAKRYRPVVRVVEEGSVTGVSDGVLSISGLRRVASEELVIVGDSARALVLSLEPDRAEAVLLDDPHAVRAGARVRSTGRQVTLMAGDPLLGRVVDPLGRPLDGEPVHGALRSVPLEREAPPLHHRAHVHTPLYTGVLAIDAMFPIGRGQRELIVGEEGTGKTTLGLDVMLRQSSTEVVAIYVAIGRRRSETWRIVEALRKSKARWVVVSAPEDASAGLRYLAPYAGTAIGELFRDRGEHAVVVYDDLSAHAIAWRELSLLLRRPPGREAYPGDIFFLHSRLLERSAQLSVDHGGGSLTALPMAVLEAGLIPAYIPTNLISITDGQIVLDKTLFAAGQKPAIDASISVSRVGAAAQPQALRDLAGRLRLDYAAFLELESFARLGTRLEERTERRLAVGRRMRRLLRAGHGAPLGVFDEVLRLVLASRTEQLAAVSEQRVGAVADELAATLRAERLDLVLRVERDALLVAQDREDLERAAARALEAAGADG